MGEVLGTLPSFSYISKNTNQMISGTGSVDGGTLIKIVDPANNIDGYSFPLAYGRSTISLQLQAIFSTTTANRPTWVQVELARLTRSAAGAILAVDTTSPFRVSIVQPGTTTFSYTFNVPEFVNEDDGEFGWTLSHNGATPVKIVVSSFKNSNPSADRVHEAHGFNMWSNGAIH